MFSTSWTDSSKSSSKRLLFRVYAPMDPARPLTPYACQPHIHSSFKLKFPPALVPARVALHAAPAMSAARSFRYGTGRFRGYLDSVCCGQEAIRRHARKLTKEARPCLQESLQLPLSEVLRACRHAKTALSGVGISYYCWVPSQSNCRR